MRLTRAKYSRREFVSGLAVSAAGMTLLDGCNSGPLGRARSGETRPSSRKKVAMVVTEVRKHSHGQHFLDRFLEGYGWQGKHHRPALDLVSIYVDQFPEGDLSRDREHRHGAKIYPSIAEALTLGGSNLAVDGVLIIGEHGRYPRNEKGQTLYPRYKFFKQVIQVFQESGRSVPVFNDKHLSTSWNEAIEMVGDSKRLGFPFMAGSSLPVTWRIPSLELPMDAPLVESVCVCYGGIDSYDFHGYETAQCMSERRAGGECGLKSVHAVKGEKIWEMLRSRDTTRKLLFAALSRSHNCKAPPGYTYPVFSVEWIQRACPDPMACFIEHQDGFRTTLFLLNGLVSDFTYAGMLDGRAEPVSCQMHLPMPPSVATTANFFNPLVNNIERMISTGVPPYPVERTLITTGMTMSEVESLYRGQVAIQTPEMKVVYKAPPVSSYWAS